MWGLEPTTPAYEAIMQSIPPPRGAAGSSPTEKEQKFVPFSFIHNLPYLYLHDTSTQKSEAGVQEKMQKLQSVLNIWKRKVK